jgi:endothelin-converting enzyme
MMRAAVTAALSVVGKPEQREFNRIFPQTVNANFDNSQNKISFSAAIMQPPLYDIELPEYMNYGAWATIAGHEITHGFDPTGRIIDETGWFAPPWDNKTSDEFNQRATCFVDQYNNYTWTSANGTVFHGQGTTGVGENVADAGGVESAYAVWKRRDMLNPAPKLPGLESFSNDQLFFIAHSRLWCEKLDDKATIYTLLADEHAVGQFRTTAAMLNSREFLSAFNCPVKQPTCELW